MKNQRGRSFSCLNALKNKSLPVYLDAMSKERRRTVRTWWHLKSYTSTDSKWSTSIVKSRILPIVFVEDIPVKALMPNLVQLYQKTLLWNVQEQTFWQGKPCMGGRPPAKLWRFFGLRSSKLEKLFLTADCPLFRTKNQRGGSFFLLKCLEK